MSDVDYAFIFLFEKIALLKNVHLEMKIADYASLRKLN